MIHVDDIEGRIEIECVALAVLAERVADHIPLPFLVEFVRVPDAHLGYLAFGWVTMGQALSLPMILLGVVLIGWGIHRRDLQPQGT